VDYTNRHQWEVEFTEASRRQLQDKFNEYQHRHGTNETNNHQQQDVDVSNIPRVLRYAYGDPLMHRRQTAPTDELQVYLQRSRELATASVDVLGWWRSNASTFPVLSVMAHDYLAVPGMYIYK
jgi:hypothetical protein